MKISSEIPFVIDEKLLKHKLIYMNKENDIQRIITHITKASSENGVYRITINTSINEALMANINATRTHIGYP